MSVSDQPTSLKEQFRRAKTSDESGLWLAASTASSPARWVARRFWLYQQFSDGRPRATEYNAQPWSHLVRLYRQRGEHQNANGLLAHKRAIEADIIAQSMSQWLHLGFALLIANLAALSIIFSDYNQLFLVGHWLWPALIVAKLSLPRSKQKMASALIIAAVLVIYPLAIYDAVGFEAFPKVSVLILLFICIIYIYLPLICYQYLINYKKEAIAVIMSGIICIILIAIFWIVYLFDLGVGSRGQIIQSSIVIFLCIVGILSIVILLNMDGFTSILISSVSLSLIAYLCFLFLGDAAPDFTYHPALWVGAIPPDAVSGELNLIVLIASSVFLGVSVLIMLARPLAHFLDFFFWAGFRYGLSPARAMFTIAFCLVVGTTGTDWALKERVLILDLEYAATIGSTDNIGLVEESAIIGLSPAPACTTGVITPAIYAADVFIPLIDLRQEFRCQVDMDRDAIRWVKKPETLAAFKALYQILGWIVISMAVITFIGAVRRTLEERLELS